MQLDTSRFTTHGRVLLAAAWLSLCSPAAANRLFIDPQFGVEVTSGIQYATKPIGLLSGERRLHLNLYRPTGANLPEELPAVVLMDGGYFFSSYAGLANFGNAFASRGYVAISIEYRTALEKPPAPGAPFTVPPERVPDWLLPSLLQTGTTLEEYLATIAAAVDDEASAVQWLVDHAETYGINPDWIAAGGFSAGAVSSLMLGAGAIDGVSADINAVFSLQGGMFGLESFIDPGDPGVFIQHGTSDDTVPYSEIPYLIDALDTAGVPYLTQIMPGQGHSGQNAWRWIEADPDPFFTFIAEQLNVPEPSSLSLCALAIAGLVALGARSRRTRCQKTGRRSPAEY